MSGQDYGYEPSPRPYWWGGVAAYAAAFFFVGSCVLNVVLISGTAYPEQLSPFRVRTWTTEVPPGAIEKWINLEPELLERLWNYRKLTANLDVSASFFVTLAFCLLLATIMSLADAFEVQGGRGAHKATKVLLVPCFIFAAALAVIDLTFHAGTVTTAAFVYERFKINDMLVSAARQAGRGSAEGRRTDLLSRAPLRRICPLAVERGACGAWRRLPCSHLSA